LPAGPEVVLSVHTDLRTGGKVSILALVVEDYKSMNIRVGRGECKQKKTKKCKKNAHCMSPSRVLASLSRPLARRGIPRYPLAVCRRQTRSAQRG
jgi:hypothetical protein